MKLRYYLFSLLWLTGTFFFPGKVKAQVPADPQYILINSVMNDPDKYRSALTYFQSVFGSGTVNRRFGVQQLITYLENGYDHAGSIRKMLNISETTNLPVFFQFDGEHFWSTRSDLWNWWDSGKAGYNPNNKINVEWTSWDPNSAVKICWRNWGAQERIAPCQNLGSPAVINEKKTKLTQLISIIVNWYNNLPSDKKYLLAGVSVAHEMALPNGFYYTNGNAYVGQNSANDPQNPTAPGATSTLGYAAVKSYGIASSGTLSPYDNNINTALHIHATTLSETAAKLGLPRNKLFVHGYGSETSYDIYRYMMNQFATPGWSFYGYANDPAIQTAFANSLNFLGNTPWAALEWRYIGNSGGDTPEAWRDALLRTLNYRSNRMVIIYNMDVVYGNCVNGLPCNGAAGGIKMALNTAPSCWLTDPVISTSVSGNNVTFRWNASSSSTNLTLGISSSSDKNIDGSLKTLNIANENISGKTSLTKTISPPGTYYWQVTSVGCSPAQKRIATGSFLAQVAIAPPTQSPSPTAPPTPTGTQVPGDFTGDGKINVVDFVLFMNYWFFKDLAKGDLNHDGKINAIDYTVFMNYWYSYNQSH